MVKRSPGVYYLKTNWSNYVSVNCCQEQFYLKFVIIMSEKKANKKKCYKSNWKWIEALICKDIKSFRTEIMTLVVYMLSSLPHLAVESLHYLSEAEKK